MFDATGFTGNLTPIERRHHRRQRTFLHGKLVFQNEGVSQDCTIRNLSETGARLQTGAPALFTADGLMVVTKTGAAHEIGLVWRRGEETGVIFTASHDLSGDVEGHLAQVRRLWTEARPR